MTNKKVRMVRGYTRLVGTLPLRILLVDDAAENRTVLKALLRPLGFIVGEAADGLQAIEQTAAFKPDLILMDMVMPHLNGLEATERIRQQPEYQEIIIIGLSASTGTETCQKNIEAGCHDFLTKPVNIDDLLEKLEHHLPLNWVYDVPETVLPQQQDELADPQSLVVPPLTVLEKLLSLAIIGDIININTQLDNLEGQDNYTVFITELKQLVTAFKINEIEQYIRHCMEGK